MSLLDRLKNRIQTNREEGIRHQSEDFITLCDFEGRICIAFQGNPLIVVPEDICSADILRKLSETRENYVVSKLRRA